MKTRREFLKTAAASAACTALLNGARSAKASLPEVQPMASRAQLDWLELGYGLFVHFGPDTFTDLSTLGQKFSAHDFAPKALDCRQWAAIARDAGMRYAVLTAKHHTGFCLWPSKHTNYSVKNSPTGDVCGEFVEAFSKVGIHTGFYYSFVDEDCDFWNDDKAYAQYMRAQITELLTQYGPVTEVYFDGAERKDHPNGNWRFDPAWVNNPNSGVQHGERWEWNQMYDLIHHLQPRCMVLNNSCSDRPGEVKYLPIDVRTAERLDFVYHERIIEPVVDPIYHAPNGNSTWLPLEVDETITPDWFWKSSDYYLHTSAEAIASWRKRAREAYGNLLLNIGPDSRGQIPEYHRAFLLKAEQIVRHGSVQS